MDPLTAKTLYDAGNNIVDKDNHIFFVAHGSVNGIYPYEIGEMTAESFVNYLSKNSELWKNTKDKSSIVIALISCETGKGENPIAQQISNLLPEAIIIAPTEEVKAVGSGDNDTINASVSGNNLILESNAIATTVKGYNM